MLDLPDQASVLCSRLGRMPPLDGALERSGKGDGEEGGGRGVAMGGVVGGAEEGARGMSTDQAKSTREGVIVGGAVRGAGGGGAGGMPADEAKNAGGDISICADSVAMPRAGSVSIRADSVTKARADSISMARGERRLAELVVQELSSKHYSLSHGLLAGLPVTAVVTTNYDTLFEEAWRGAQADFHVLPYETGGADR
jgi:hypothetical protein